MATRPPSLKRERILPQNPSKARTSMIIVSLPTPRHDQTQLHFLSPAPLPSHEQETPLPSPDQQLWLFPASRRGAVALSPSLCPPPAIPLAKVGLLVPLDHLICGKTTSKESSPRQKVASRGGRAGVLKVVRAVEAWSFALRSAGFMWVYWWSLGRYEGHEGCVRALRVVCTQREACGSVKGRFKCLENRVVVLRVVRAR